MVHTIFITSLKVVAWVVLVHVTKTLEKSCSFFSLRWLTHNVSSKPPNCPFLSSVGLEAADSDRWTSFHQQKLDRTLKHVQTSFFSPSPLWLTSPLVFFFSPPHQSMSIHPHLSSPHLPVCPWLSEPRGALAACRWEASAGGRRSRRAWQCAVIVLIKMPHLS